MKNTIKNTSWSIIILAISAMLLLDSCKCNEDKYNNQDVQPDCEIKWAEYINGSCQCPPGSKQLGNYCINFQYENPNERSWVPILHNGNCFDSVLCFWNVDTSIIGSDEPGMFGGIHTLTMSYYGIHSEKANQYRSFTDGQVVIEEIPEGYYIYAFSLTGSDHPDEVLPCFEPRANCIRAEGIMNKSLDTFWAHHEMFMWPEFHDTLGEFDQIYVKFGD